MELDETFAKGLNDFLDKYYEKPSTPMVQHASLAELVLTEKTKRGRKEEALHAYFNEYQLEDWNEDELNELLDDKTKRDIYLGDAWKIISRNKARVKNEKKFHAYFNKLLDRNLSGMSIDGYAKIFDMHDNTFRKLPGNYATTFPSKRTVLAACIALRCKINEAFHLLSYAGYTFEQDSVLDMETLYCLSVGVNNIYDLNAFNADHGHSSFGNLTENKRCR